jgi:hypothetical protein
MTRVKTLKEAGHEDSVDLAEQADKLQDIKALADTNGGKEIIKLLLTDAVNAMRKMSTNYATYTHSDFIAQCATINANVSLAKLLINSKDNLEYLDEQIAELLAQ